jgi:hypothetical protein
VSIHSGIGTLIAGTPFPDPKFAFPVWPKKYPVRLRREFDFHPIEIPSLSTTRTSEIRPVFPKFPVKFPDRREFGS